LFPQATTSNNRESLLGGTTDAYQIYWEETVKESRALPDQPDWPQKSTADRGRNSVFTAGQYMKKI